MNPPRTLDVTDTNNGFTALMRSGDTLWRPIGVLRGKPPIGALADVVEDSFYQSNNNVTRATYKVRGYGYPILVWFDNITEERIA